LLYVDCWHSVTALYANSQHRAENSFSCLIKNGLSPLKLDGVLIKILKT
jgi:hypothetical protein